MLKRALLVELSHFRLLSETAQQLIKSIAVYCFLFPLLYLFVNAYILRNTHDFAAVAIYNMGIYVALPITFYINGFLLRKYPIHLPYLIGMVGQGVVACLVFFLSFRGYGSLFIFGLLYGVPMGLYWANRNFLSLDVTKDENRVYFTGIELVLSTLGGVLMPILIGWTISLGEHFHFYSADLAYRGLGLLSLLVLFWGGAQLANTKFRQPRFKTLHVTAASSLWNAARLAEVFRGFQSGVYLFFPPLVVFTFFGKEGSLGTLQSTAALLGALIVYSLARQIKPGKRVRTLNLSVFVLVGLSLFFVVSFSQLAALLFVLFTGTLFQVQWMSSNPVTMKVIDEEEDGDPTNNYAYVCNRELFLNIGRILGIMLFLSLSWLQSQHTALRVVPMITAILQIGLAVSIARLAKKA